MLLAPPGPPHHTPCPRWDELSSRKICEVTFARVQGREALIEHFRAAKFPSTDADLQPLVFTKVGTGIEAGP